MMGSSDRGVKRSWPARLPAVRGGLACLALFAVCGASGCGEDGLRAPAGGASPATPPTLDEVCRPEDGAESTVQRDRWSERAAVGTWTIDPAQLVQFGLAEAERQWAKRLEGASPRQIAQADAERRRWVATHRAEMEAEAKSEFGALRLEVRADHTFTETSQQVIVGEWRACGGSVWLRRTCDSGVEAPRGRTFLELWIAPSGDGEAGTLDIGAAALLPVVRQPLGSGASKLPPPPPVRDGKASPSRGPDADPGNIRMNPGPRYVSPNDADQQVDKWARVIGLVGALVVLGLLGRLMRRKAPKRS